MVLRLKARESRSPPGHQAGSSGNTHNTHAGWSSPVARQAHNLKVTGSNPVPASIIANTSRPKPKRPFPTRTTAFLPFRAQGSPTNTNATLRRSGHRLSRPSLSASRQAIWARSAWAWARRSVSPARRAAAGLSRGSPRPARGPRRRERGSVAVVTGRISTRTPRGRSSQYGSTGRSRVSMGRSPYLKLGGVMSKSDIVVG
jgi:hypothetical protein